MRYFSCLAGFDAVEVGRRASCCLLVITGDNDPLVPMDVVYELQGTVEKENRTMDDFEIQVVEGAGHAFAHHPKTELDKIDSEISLSQGVEYLCVNL